MSDQFNLWGNTQAPYSQEAEEATLGAILAYPVSYEKAAAILKEKDFFIVRHRYIWEAMTRLAERGEPIEYVTLREELIAIGKLQDIGGAVYLTQLINNTPSAANIEFYAQLVERTATRRRLMAASNDIKALALDTSKPLEDVLPQAMQTLEEAMPQDRKHVMPGNASIDYYNQQLEKTAEKIKSGKMVAYPVPQEWKAVAELVPFFYEGDFWVLTGKPGSGKSAAMEQLGEHFARSRELFGCGVATDYIHTEMTTEEIMHRRMARHSGLPYDLLRTAGYTATQKGFTPGQEAARWEAESNIADFAPRLNYTWMPDAHFEQLATHMRRQALAGVKVFLIDHFQDLQMGGRENNIVREYERACLWLAGFAEFRQVIVVTASQENKQGQTKWTNKLLEKAKTRISIKIKQVEGEYNYTVDNSVTEYRCHQGQRHPISIFAVEKARFGKTGAPKMFYHGPRFTWFDVSRSRQVLPKLSYMPSRAAGEKE